MRSADKLCPLYWKVSFYLLQPNICRYYSVLNCSGNVVLTTIHFLVYYDDKQMEEVEYCRASLSTSYLTSDCGIRIVDHVL
jgi:hypothetical protein